MRAVQITAAAWVTLVLAEVLSDGTTWGHIVFGGVILAVALGATLLAGRVIRAQERAGSVALSALATLFGGILALSWFGVISFAIGDFSRSGWMADWLPLSTLGALAIAVLVAVAGIVIQIVSLRRPQRAARGVALSIGALGLMFLSVAWYTAAMIWDTTSG